MVLEWFRSFFILELVDHFFVTDQGALDMKLSHLRISITSKASYDGALRLRFRFFFQEVYTLIFSFVCLFLRNSLTISDSLP
jgi:hypothetical protein